MLAGWQIPMHNFWAVMSGGTLGVLGRSKQSKSGPNNGSYSAGPGRTKRVSTGRTHACFCMENRGLRTFMQMQKLALHAKGFCDVCWVQFCRNFCVTHTGQQAATPWLWMEKQVSSWWANLCICLIEYVDCKSTEKPLQSLRMQPNGFETKRSAAPQ